MRQYNSITVLSPERLEQYNSITVLSPERLRGAPAAEPRAGRVSTVLCLVVSYSIIVFLCIIVHAIASYCIVLYCIEV